MNFASLVNQLTDTDHRSEARSQITIREYRRWQRHYTLDALKGIGYGQSFCDYFKITDNRIRYERMPERCNRLIERSWLKKCTA